MFRLGWLRVRGATRGTPRRDRTRRRRWPALGLIACLALLQSGCQSGPSGRLLRAVQPVRILQSRLELASSTGATGTRGLLRIRRSLRTFPSSTGHPRPWPFRRRLLRTIRAATRGHRPRPRSRPIRPMTWMRSRAHKIGPPPGGSVRPARTTQLEDQLSQSVARLLGRRSLDIVTKVVRPNDGLDA